MTFVTGLDKRWLEAPALEQLDDACLTTGLGATELEYGIEKQVGSVDDKFLF